MIQKPAPITLIIDSLKLARLQSCKMISNASGVMVRGQCIMTTAGLTASGPDFDFVSEASPSGRSHEVEVLVGYTSYLCEGRFRTATIEKSVDSGTVVTFTFKGALKAPAA